MAELASHTTINNLPPEILIRIFSIAIACSPCSPTSTKRDCLLDIPLVCGRWHLIAANASSLWTHIDMHAGLSFRKDYVPPFSRATLWLRRSTGMPIHLHFYGLYPLPREVVSKLVYILQPYTSSIYSLVIDGLYADFLAENLLALYSSCEAPVSLKTLSISSVRIILGANSVIRWPISSIRGLVRLELYNFDGYLRVELDKIATMLSGCPALHTLTLSRLEIYSPRQQWQQFSILLLSLRFFEVSNVHGLGSPQLWSMLCPGPLELDVRLGTIHDFSPTAPIAEFLERSNVVSLTFRCVEPAYAISCILLLSSVPRLRALNLIMDYSLDFGPSGTREIGYKPTLDVLCGLLPEYTVPQLRSLQSLCLNHGIMHQVDMDSLADVIAAVELRNLVFIHCRFVPVYSQSSNSHEDNTDANTRPTGDIPPGVFSWLSRRVKNIAIYGTLPDRRVDGGVDSFVQNLIAID